MGLLPHLKTILIESVIHLLAIEHASTVNVLRLMARQRILAPPLSVQPSCLSDLLKYLEDDDPDTTVKEGDYPLVECATWADDIKYHGGMW